jgi:eukaryotic-like serine/threonine-protein kinase
VSAVESFKDRARLRVGTTLREKWHLDSLLGVGGTAAVYAATHRNGRRLAVKVLRPELASYADVVTRFVREGYVANQVKHANVVSVLDDDIAEDGAPFLVMELLEGSSLERFAKNPRNLLPMAEVVRIGEDLLDVLAAAHDAGIVHRDIKPANIFLTRNGVLKVLDFGIARIGEALDSGMTQTGTAIGTPGYMPPEQARGRWSEVDGRTDLWAVGATMYALFVGNRPRRAETMQEELLLAMTQPLPPSRLHQPALPEALAQFIDKSVAFERHDRFPDARSMQYALKSVRSLVVDFSSPSTGERFSGAPESLNVLHGIAGAPITAPQHGSGNFAAANAQNAARMHDQRPVGEEEATVATGPSHQVYAAPDAQRSYPQGVQFAAGNPAGPQHGPPLAFAGTQQQQFAPGQIPSAFQTTHQSAHHQSAHQTGSYPGASQSQPSGVRYEPGQTSGNAVVVPSGASYTQSPRSSRAPMVALAAGAIALVGALGVAAYVLTSKHPARGDAAASVESAGANPTAATGVAKPPIAPPPRVADTAASSELTFALQTAAAQAVVGASAGVTAPPSTSAHLAPTAHVGPAAMVPPSAPTTKSTLHTAPHTAPSSTQAGTKTGDLFDRRN